MDFFPQNSLINLLYGIVTEVINIAAFWTFHRSVEYGCCMNISQKSKTYLLYGLFTEFINIASVWTSRKNHKHYYRMDFSQKS